MTSTDADRLAAWVDKPVSLATPTGAPEQVHVLSEAEALAIRTALAARRALLVRGEPGTGKTQLARAAATALKRAFVSHVVDSRTESRDLMWHFDAVARLAEAQVQGALRSQAAARRAAAELSPADPAAQLRDTLRIERFIHPRPLWWAFDWPDAARQAELARIPAPTQPDGCDPANGVVVLIDEIDKAETEVPNGLLEALGAGEFTPQGFPKPVSAAAGQIPPLVLITTNEERALPDAFLRRCLVLQLDLPKSRPDLIAHLVTRGTAHFRQADPDLLAAAAEMLVDDRDRARAADERPLPGQAEFIDLVRAVLELAPEGVEAQRAMLDRIRPFALRKHRDPRG